MDRDGDKKLPCIPSGILGRLAVRLASERDRHGLQGESAIRSLLDAVLSEEEAELEEHLIDCRPCRMRLLAEIHRYGQYLEGIDETAGAGGEARGEDPEGGEAVKGGRGDGIQRTIALEPLPYEGRGNNGAMAADTSNRSEKPLRFVSKERDFILRRFLDAVENRWLVQLTGILPVSYDRITVVIDGAEHELDGGGFVMSESGDVPLSPDSNISLSVK